MSQDSIAVSTTPPLPGLALVQQINAANQAIATDFSGASDPAADAGPYMTWADTANGVLKRRNAAGTAWIVEGTLFKQSLPIFSLADLPTSDKGPINVIGFGLMEWDGTRYAKLSRLEVTQITANGSFVVPSGQTQILYRGGAGAGGGGGGSGYVATTTQLHGGGGGAGQSVDWTALSVTPGETLTVQIGAGGAGGPGGATGGVGTAGGNGGQTKLLRGATVLLTLDFGRGGSPGAAGGPASGGSGYPDGGDGSGCQGVTASNAIWLHSGAGSGSLFGVGGPSASALSSGRNGLAGSGYGAGGAGGCAPVASGGSGAGGNGGAGRPGIFMFGVSK